MAPLTAAEILAHPEFPYVTWTLPATRKERVVVGRGRGGPFRIAYEVHGKGPIRLVVSQENLIPFRLPCQYFPIRQYEHVWVYIVHFLTNTLYYSG
jgi:hypothetical protein